MIDVAFNWQRVCHQAAEAVVRAGRAPGSVRVVAAAKTKPPEMVAQAIAAGATDIGENYVQEALDKARSISAPVTWHMIGHLQRNKVGRALQLFEVIHTLDSVALGEALARHAEQRGRRVRVLIEVNIADEPTKHGAARDDVERLLAALAGQSWLEIDGLMAIPPQGPSAESARPHFRALRMLRDQLRAQAPPNAPLRELSMGMTDDFPVAIEEGATIVRIGRAIFGERAPR